MDEQRPQPQAFVFMKVGAGHGESLGQIVERKNREVRDEEMMFWGYNGKLIHPLKQVQPFAEHWEQAQGRIELLMQVTPSKGIGRYQEVSEYSPNKQDWKRIPDGIKTDCKMALVCEEIRPVSYVLDLARYKVGIGPSCGRNAAGFVKDHTSKACLVATKAPPGTSASQAHISFQARLIPPYAVYLR